MKELIETDNRYVYKRNISIIVCVINEFYDEYNEEIEINNRRCK